MAGTQRKSDPGGRIGYVVRPERGMNENQETRNKKPGAVPPGAPLALSLLLSLIPVSLLPAAVIPV